jgi:galacturonosyltransferase
MFQNAKNMELAKELGMVKGKYRLLPGSGVDVDRFPACEYPEGGDGKEGAPVIFNYIGRILHDKGVDDYIGAAKRIKAEYPNTEFNMLGFIEPSEAHYENELRELEKEGTVLYRGQQTDVRPWIERSHCIIHPSTYGEGMSNVLLENASSARPIITTDNPGCEETVIDGVSGFIFKGGDVDALCAAIARFLATDNEKRKTAGLRGREFVSENFSRETVISEYLTEIKELLEGRE